MARQLRVQYAGAIYHVTARSNGDEDLFRGDLDRKYLLSRLADAAETYGVRVYLFCLMDNHFHLVVETPRPNLSYFMQSLLGGYSINFNRVHRRHGHVTQGRYGAKLVSGDEYLLKLSRYVHLNPVKMKGSAAKTLKEKITILRSYCWSSYPAYIGKSARNEFVDYEPMLSLMEGKKKNRPTKYRRFVESGIQTRDDEFLVELVRSSRSIGSERFRDWVDQCYSELAAKQGVKEDVSFRCVGKAVSADEILKEVAAAARVNKSELLVRRRDSTWRAVASRMLCKYGGLTQRDVAAILGAGTGVAISCQLKKLRGLLAQDEVFRKRVERIERSLRKRRA